MNSIQKVNETIIMNRRDYKILMSTKLINNNERNNILMRFKTNLE